MLQYIIMVNSLPHCCCKAIVPRTLLQGHQYDNVHSSYNIIILFIFLSLFQSIPADMEFDPHFNPPCYRTKEEVRDSHGGYKPALDIHRSFASVMCYLNSLVSQGLSQGLTSISHASIITGQTEFIIRFSHRLVVFSTIC